MLSEYGVIRGDIDSGFCLMFCGATDDGTFRIELTQHGTGWSAAYFEDGGKKGTWLTSEKDIRFVLKEVIDRFSP